MPAAAPRVVFRTDGNATIGLGHVMRCLALAAMLQPDFTCVFAMRQPEPFLQDQVRAAGRELWLLPEDLAAGQEPAWLLARLQPTDIVVLDGYQFGPAYAYPLWQRQPVAWLDDLAAHYLWADVVINQAGGINPETYAGLTVPGAQLCLGPAYALLRPPFQQAARQPTRQPDTSRIFLNMGGADPENHTLRLVRELRQRFPDKALEVVTGAAYPHQRELAQQTQPLAAVTLHHNVTAENLVGILQRCGLHVCPPSGMAYECCAVGGLLLLHPIADNQRHLLAYLTAAGLAQPYANLPALPASQLPQLARQAAERQRQVFDGEAGPRFRQVFQALHAAARLTVRRARAEDARQYFEWANDADVRRNAVHSEPIEWSTHLGWFSRRLPDADSFLYMFELADEPVGQVRIEFDDLVGTIDYSVAAASRGQGMGLAVLRRALRQLRLEKPGAWAVLGQVKSGNLPSCRVFQRLGFAQLPARELPPDTYHVFRLDVAPAPVS